MPDQGQTQAAALAQAYARAATLHEQGRLDQAEAAYRQILAAHPDQLDTLHLFGILMIQTGRVEPGLAMVDRALAIMPNFTDAQFNRATALLQLSRPAEALAGFDKTLASQRSHVGALFSRSLALAQLQRFDEALASFDRFLTIQPQNPDALLNRGVTLNKLGRYAEALAGFDKVVALQPQDADAHFNRGGVLKQLGRLEEAEASFERALALRPGWPDALVNRGVTLKMLGRPADAVVDYDRALAAAPAHIQALVSRGAALIDLGRLDAAMADYAKALTLEPGNALAAFNRSLALLMSGRFEEGWTGYERRKDLTAAGAPSRAASLAQPQWDGRAPLQGKTLFVHWEQGLGDTIQFCRYAGLAADRDARVVLSVQNPLLPLLKDFDPRVTVIGGDQAPPAFDFHAPLLSLPGVFATDLQNIPSPRAYLAAASDIAAVWAQRLGASDKPRIGLVWSGAAGHENDRNRSTALATLTPLLNASVDWFCLQKDIREPDLETLARTPQLKLYENAVADFPGTAALIANMDLVIAVDTSIAHLAAAMGKPTWLLLSSAPDWRWMRDRADSPWYNAVRLFRQTSPGDWPGVVEQVQAALNKRFA